MKMEIASRVSTLNVAFNNYDDVKNSKQLIERCLKTLYYDHQSRRRLQICSP